MSNIYETRPATVISETRKSPDQWHEFEFELKHDAGEGLDATTLIVIRDEPGTYKVGTIYKLTLEVQEA